MRRHHLFLLTSVLVALLAIVPGCRKQPPTTTPEPKQTEPVGQPAKPTPDRPETDDKFPTEAPPPPEEITSVDVWNQRGVLRTIYFALDSSELTPESTAVLRDNAAWLKSHADFKLVVEGHCDERGSIEYNLALGELRAKSVREYLTTLGVAKPRVRILTFGEERPADPGHAETAWSKNRRAAFLLED